MSISESQSVNSLKVTAGYVFTLNRLVQESDSTLKPINLLSEKPASKNNVELVVPSKLDISASEEWIKKEKGRISGEFPDLPINDSAQDIAGDIGAYIWMFYLGEEGNTGSYLYSLETYRNESKKMTLVNPRYTDDIINLLSEKIIYDQLRVL